MAGSAQLQKIFNNAIHFYQNEQYQNAAEQFEKALKLAPGNVSCLHNLGLMHYLQDNAETAIPYFRKAIKREPKYTDARFNLANALVAVGKKELAEKEFIEVLKQQSSHPGALNNYANLLDQQGKVDEAHSMYLKVTEVNSEFADAWKNLGSTASREGRWAEAIKAYDRYLHLNPRDHTSWLALAKVHAEMRNWQDAELALTHATEIDPDYVEAWREGANNLLQQGRAMAAKTLVEAKLDPENIPQDADLLGAACEHIGLLEEAEQAFRDALAMDPDLEETAVRLGNCLVSLRRYDEAQTVLESVLEKNPGCIPASTSLATLLVTQGQKEKACEMFRHNIESEPQATESYAHLARLTRYSSAEDSDIQEMESVLINGALEDLSAVHIHFALGKAYDDCAEYDRAYEHYLKANSIKARTEPFNREKLEKSTSALIDTFTPEFVQRCARSSNESSPVFVLGLARSGTTLIEQIIAAHQFGYGAGELVVMNELVYRLQAAKNNEIPFPKVLGESSSTELDELASRYIEVSHRNIGENIVAVVDKMPFNFTYIGLIFMLFPKAKIIHCTRDLRDTFISNFFQNFPLGVNFSYTPDDLKDYILAYKTIMSHWQSLFGEQMYEANYESMVNDQDQQTRNLINYLDLPWDDNCLNYHKTKNPVRTLSVWQVKQPIYKGSVGRWKNYDEYFDAQFTAIT